MVERTLMVRLVVRSIPHGRPIQLLFFAANVPRLVKRITLYVLSCLCDGLYQISIPANWREQLPTTLKHKSNSNKNKKRNKPKEKKKKEKEKKEDKRQTIKTTKQKQTATNIICFIYF